MTGKRYTEIDGKTIIRAVDWAYSWHKAYLHVCPNDTTHRQHKLTWGLLLLSLLNHLNGLIECNDVRIVRICPHIWVICLSQSHHIHIGERRLLVFPLRKCLFSHEMSVGRWSTLRAFKWVSAHNCERCVYHAPSLVVTDLDKQFYGR